MWLQRIGFPGLGNLKGGLLSLFSVHSCCFQLLKLRDHSDEQKERTETAEYQISTISQEYRKLLESRDVEIRRLKTENDKLREEMKRFAYDDVSELHSPLKLLAQLQLSDSDVVDRDLESVDIGVGGGGEWTEQYHEDFSDVISSQAEINRLRSELTKLRMEVRCKTVAADKVRRYIRA